MESHKKKQKKICVPDICTLARTPNLKQLNDQTLVSCKKVGRGWLNCIKDQRIYWIRKIQKLSAKFNEFQKLLIQAFSLPFRDHSKY